jgi:lipoprotein-anchoring transpeptidase ErfK/SrfK
MNNQKFFLAAVAAMVFAAPASAFHPFEETYGYVMPKKFRKGDSAARASAREEGKESKQSKSFFNNDDDEDEVSDTQRKYGSKQSSGGGKPFISPAAPPKVSFPNHYGAGTIVIDTASRRLYYVLSSSAAYSYPIAVGKQGFAWSGTETISKKVAWPDWNPPKEMLKRKPSLPEHMSGGVRNPLGAMALYLGNSLYRIHGTNDVKSIGTAASSGCIRMTNRHVMHLAKLVNVGTTVHVLKRLPKHIAKAASSDEG